MDKTLAAQRLRVRCIDRNSDEPALDQDCLDEALWHVHHGDVLAPWRGRFDLDAQDFVVLVNDPGGRLLGVLTASLRHTGQEQILLLEGAYAAPAAFGCNLLQRMAAVLLLNVVRFDGTPAAIVACTRSEAVSRNLLDLRRHIITQAAFPDPQARVIGLAVAGLARRVARMMRPGSRYAACSGVFLDHAADHRLVVLTLDANHEALVAADARRFYERRPTRAEAVDEFVQGQAMPDGRAAGAPRETPRRTSQ